MKSRKLENILEKTKTTRKNWLFFREYDGNYIPRAIVTDLDRETIDNMKNSSVY